MVICYEMFIASISAPIIDTKNNRGLNKTNQKGFL